jgi:integrase
MELMSADDYYRAKDIEDISSDPLPAGRRVSRGELAACIQSCPPTANGDRDAALLGVLYGTGIRRAELTALDLADYSHAEGVLVVLHGKGRTERNARVVPSAAAHLDRWIVRRNIEPGPLFYPVRVGGEIEHRRLSSVGVVKALRRIADRAQVERFSPHDLRRTWITDLLEGGVDLAMVQTLAGHKNVSTTAGYDRRGEKEAHLAADVISVPKRQGKPPCKPTDGQKKQ